ncbi:extracellular GDSL-like lipase/acylhydrolase [Mollisia scopiformis]|uniref:Extracellular GDSL-like lipase/acylhydrolase n=1 Tax=Mollisia scopiformis TaxID=149040 RepID=A0A194XMJ0_MOLSC|nr:extracellular GDSL-like lipase/acylhydrolase [Mollisia scopiformis]KUJ21346.1 extracellular GDSL-like lipase/acylhydrolase [Mollisia scopiformis]
MPQLTEPANLPPAPYNETGAVFVNSTIRQTLHMSLGGSPIRIQISNAFGTTDLPITSVTVALPTNGSAGVAAIQPSTLHTVTFSGSKNYTIPNGALVVSDPIPMTVAPQSNLAVSIYLEDGQLSATNAITSHPGSRTTSWMSMGNQVSKQNITDETTESVQHWYFVSAVEVWRERSARGFVIVGDSITDGRGSDTDENDRWPDLVLARMQRNPDTSDIAVLNQAAGGNRILYDGLGPNALGRINRDVLSQSGIAYAMIFEGVNDIGTAATDAVSQKNVGDRIIAAYKQIVERVHAHGIPMFATTITPFSAPGYNVTAEVYSDPEREATRQRVNSFIRYSGTFDKVIDFDAILRNDSLPYLIQADLQGGDWLHPNAAGYQKISQAFPLDIF